MWFLHSSLFSYHITSYCHMPTMCTVQSTNTLLIDTTTWHLPGGSKRFFREVTWWHCSLTGLWFLQWNPITHQKRLEGFHTDESNVLFLFFFHFKLMSHELSTDDVPYLFICQIILYSKNKSEKKKFVLIFLGISQFRGFSCEAA